MMTSPTSAPGILVVVPSLTGDIRRLRQLGAEARSAGASFVVVANSRRLCENLRNAGEPFVTSRENSGFASSVALGASSSDWAWLVVLNDDVDIESGVLAEALTADALTAAAADIVHLDDSEVRAIPGRARVFGNVSLLANAWRKVQRRPLEEGPTTYRSFSAVAISRRVWERLGGLDTRYTFTFEDADFVRRAHEAGFSSVALDRPVVHHRHSETSTSFIDKVLPASVYSSLVYLDKWHPGALRNRLLLIGALGVRTVMVIASSGRWAQHWSGIRSAIRGITGSRAPELPRWETV